MKQGILLIATALLTSSCSMVVFDDLPPAIPAGIRTISLDDAVQLDWIENTEPDFSGYHVWVSDRYNGRYTRIGTTNQPHFIDYGARNGETYYYGVTAFDLGGNESEMSRDVAYDTPRPEGYNVSLYNFGAYPDVAGYDFSTYSVGQYDDNFTDVFFENANGIFYLNVWSDTDIQDMGHTETLDDISVAPSGGWSPSGSAEAIIGHTYVVWTWDDHYAKVRVKDVTSSRVVFDWAYQTAPANPELSRTIPPHGRTPVSKRPDQVQ